MGGTYETNINGTHTVGNGGLRTGRILERISYGRHDIIRSSTGISKEGNYLLNKWEIKSAEKVCAFDIDGVLNYYPQPWVQYLMENTTEYWVHPGAAVPAMSDGTIALDFFKKKIPYNVYRGLKEDYRLKGGELSMMPRIEAQGTLACLKDAGWAVVIITARPAWRYPQQYAQTVEWLKKNRLAHDHIVFDENKHIRVIEEFPHLGFMVEDHRYIANNVAKWNYKVFLVNNPYNEGAIVHGVQRVNNLDEILKEVL